jgi:ubiquinone/menaquinone biosynthesis C-methylase UbiE
MESKIGILSRVAEIYKSGGNIIQLLKEMNGQSKNSLEDILISYDFQAGSYIDFVINNPDYIKAYTKLIANEFEKLNLSFNSIMEVGVGEATTLGNVINQLTMPIKSASGFDISWSRIHYGNHYLQQKKVSNVNLFTGDLFNIPLGDNSVDVVYTSHSLEPNGGKEKEALKELYRVTNKYMVLLEPGYELANVEAKKRMDSHGYVKNLVKVAKDLGYNVIENRLFELCANPLNPTQIIIIEKQKENEIQSCEFYCPITKTPLEKGVGYYFTSEGFLAYPIIKNIPCLLPQNAIVATHLNDF